MRRRDFHPSVSLKHPECSSQQFEPVCMLYYQQPWLAATARLPLLLPANNVLGRSNTTRHKYLCRAHQTEDLPEDDSPVKGFLAFDLPMRKVSLQSLIEPKQYTLTYNYVHTDRLCCQLENTIQPPLRFRAVIPIPLMTKETLHISSAY